MGVILSDRNGAQVISGRATTPVPSIPYEIITWNTNDHEAVHSALPHIAS